MRYAHVNGIQIEAAPGLKGSCPGCGNSVTAKCGSIKVHHWAHLKRIDCDPWWEPMTQWHLDWQNQFPKDWREVIFRNPDTKGHHRADVHTPGGITLEFQYSAISPEEIESRNTFYAQLIWIVNGSRFKNFQIGAAIPNPKSHLFAGYRIYTDQYGQPKLAHSSGKLYSFDDPRIRDLAELQKSQPIFHLFNWKYKHRAWLNCGAPVFLDFGDDVLYWIKKKLEVISTMYYLQVVTKKNFLDKYTSDNSPATK